VTEIGRLVRCPSAVPTSELTILDPLQQSFAGFAEEAFLALERLKNEPNISRYEKERQSINRYLKQPFQDYRDDLVVNCVLPSRLGLETERNVFSRILKNDFGRGGAHHHMWMAFYRPGTTRLRDIQLMHSLHPDSFCVGVYCGQNSMDRIRRIQLELSSTTDEVASVLDDVLLSGRLSFSAWDRRRDLVAADSVGTMVSAIKEASAWRLTRVFAREDVLETGPSLIDEALTTIRDVWPFYRLMIQLSDE
jgi:hypothetical protein